ncbi:MAG: magnesium/cobalt transporter CorA [Myxococcales bacterium]|nr:magnesium/cobalt transporter CorA [Myxococcales bacterium]MCB9520782.1 magnesium/cobalt transporter CorA [Myxococcales bacterium]MCB9532474.1 magnesium/cobalt transporter CorA [Myxococcales bacterium]MCB9533499.1 magnesium/cobalt transporter CorA [Myxococcales bacterium]
MTTSRIRSTRRLPSVGAAPSPTPLAKVFAFGPDGFVEEQVDFHRLDALRATYPVVWADVDGHGDLQLLDALRDSLGLHHLAVEDVVNLGQRPKLEEYDENLFVVLREAQLTDATLVTEQLSIFLADGLVVSFQEAPGDVFDSVRERIRSARGRVRRSGADYLFYALIDAVVDSYFPLLERIGDNIEALEDAVLLEATDDVISPIHVARRELLVLRKCIDPLRDALGRVPTEESAFIGEESRVYFRDVVDHLNRAHDLVDTYRDLCHSVMDSHLSVMSARLNDVMGLLTVISTIFIPLGFLVGVWGMNFDPAVSKWNMPELRWEYGYPAAIAVMALVAGAQLWFFRRRGWIRLRRRRAAMKRG